MIAWATARTPDLPNGPGHYVTADEIGKSFLGEHLLAFELLSVLLLITMIGAIVLARKSDFGSEPVRTIPVRGEKAAR